MSNSSKTYRSVFSLRLKEAREKAGISQRRLGIEAGMDEFVASTRVNRYEKGIHEPDEATAVKLAQVLNIPLAYFYADDDRLAEVILLFSCLPERDKQEYLKFLRAKMPQ
ncbi:helix-turn-helix domain-containing protein [Oxalobacter paraformigenes]|uniref:HTH cro/C1-type domain-containing protein n=1 Tax=Oxalobacter paraformigenes TaxID=556268 RepID=C3X4Q8_9BURK|nr:helix-turn-helix transcriptional regulator [Oxalobacter paraformigenes]EEO28194.1 hypothetical protein OFAG_01347 [Oxalobacter paraformigenes]